MKYPLLILLISTCTLNTFAQYNCTITPLTAHQNRNINCLTVDKNQNVWAGTSNGLINLFNGKHILENIEINKLVIDQSNNIWIVTEHDSIKQINMQGEVLQSVHFLDLINKNDSTLYADLQSEYIESVSTNEHYVVFGLSNGSLIVHNKVNNNFEFNHIKETLNGTPIKYAYVYSKLSDDKDKSQIVCTDWGIFTDSQERNKFEKVKDLAKKSYKILPSHNPDEIYWFIGRNFSDNSIVGKIIVHPKDPDKKQADSRPIAVTSECLLPNHKIKFNDFALTKSDNVWVATNEGILYYAYNDNCRAKTILQENCSNQSLLIIDKAKFPNFPLDTINYIACANDSTICFANTKGKSYKMLISKDLINNNDSNIISIKNINTNKYKSFQFNFNKCRTCTTPSPKIKRKEKRFYKKYVDMESDNANKTGKEVAISNFREIEKAVDADDDQRYDIHIFAYAANYNNESLSKEVATDRANYIHNIIDSYVEKKRINLHIVGYLPKDKGGPDYPDTVIVEVKCSSRDYSTPKSIRKTAAN
jgi:hypothetical protein